MSGSCPYCLSVLSSPRHISQSLLFQNLLNQPQLSQRWSRALPTFPYQPSPLQSLQIQSKSLQSIQIQSKLLKSLQIQSNPLQSLQIPSSLFQSLRSQSSPLQSLLSQSTLLPFARWPSWQLSSQF